MARSEDNTKVLGCCQRIVTKVGFVRGTKGSNDHISSYDHSSVVAAVPRDSQREVVTSFLAQKVVSMRNDFSGAKLLVGSLMCYT